jgi:hypothetical protein
MPFKIIFTLLLYFVCTITAAENSIANLQENLQRVFVKEITVNYTKLKQTDYPQAWGFDHAASVALFEMAQKQEEEKFEKLRSLTFDDICKILSANQKAYFQVAALEHKVGVFDQRLDFSTVIFFHEHEYPGTFAAWDALQKAQNKK